MKKITDEEIDEINNGIDLLLIYGHFQFVDKHLGMLISRIWRTDVNELLSYATITLPAKNKLKNRKLFIETCMVTYPNKKLWKGLE